MNVEEDHEPGLRRLCVVVDVENYRGRTGPGQQAVQNTLHEVLGAAASAAGLNRSGWYRQEAGDGELAVLPTSESETALVGLLPAALDTALSDTARHCGVSLRLRVAMHHGVAVRAALGYAGTGVITARGIVDARPVRQVLSNAPEARLVVVLSDSLFIDVIRSGYTTLRASAFRRIEIDEEKFRATAWVMAPGVEPSHLLVNDRSADQRRAPISRPRRADATPAAPGGFGAVHAPYGTFTAVSGDLNMPGGHIGPSRG